MNVYNKNKNGETYLILEQRGDTALLARIGEPKFIVASVFDKNATSWGGGKYFWTLEEAYECYREGIK